MINVLKMIVVVAVVLDNGLVEVRNTQVAIGIDSKASTESKFPMARSYFTNA